MIRLALISDSHGHGPNLRAAAEALAACDALCHMGDVVPDGRRLSQQLNLPLHAVRGNCDVLAGVADELTLDVAGHKLLLSHGHRYGVKRSMTALSLRARQAGADIVLYGHTHLPQVDWDGPVLFINPGALCDGRYAILEFRDNGPVPVMKIL